MLMSIKFIVDKRILTLLMATLLILPLIWSLTPVIYGNNAQLPISGPELARQGDAFDRRPDLSRLITYLKKNRGNATYIAAAPSAMSMGAELILQSREPVMILGGFNGGDNPLNVEQFKALIAKGTVKYAIISKDQAGNSPKQTEDASKNINSWIIGNCLEINENFEGVSLYQLMLTK